mgnify:CR=1 FL=1
MDDSIVDLLYGGNSPEEKGRASALAAALRKQKQFGEMALLLRDPYLTQYGNSLIGDAGEQQNRLYKAPQDRNTLDRGRQALMDEKFKYQQGVEEDQRLKGRPDPYSQNLSTKMFRGVDPNTTTAGDFERNAKIAAQLYGDDRSYWARMAAINEQKADRKQKYAQPPKDTIFDDEMALRKQFEGSPIIKIATETADAYKMILNAAENPSGPGDKSILFAFAKLLDPDSVVMEGEQQRLIRTGSIPDWLWAAYNKATQGLDFGDDVRNAILKESGNIYNSRMNDFDVFSSEYGNIGSIRGLNRENITGPISKTVRVNRSAKKADPSSKNRSFVKNGKKYEIEGDKIYEVD